MFSRTVCINGDELTDLKESDAAEVEAMQLSRAAAAKRSAAERKKRYAKIDRICLATFPLLFLTFNCCYWLAYTTRCQVGGRLCDQNWTRLISELSTVFMDRKKLKCQSVKMSDRREVAASLFSWSEVTELSKYSTFCFASTTCLCRLYFGTFLEKEIRLSSVNLHLYLEHSRQAILLVKDALSWTYCGPKNWIYIDKTKIGEFEREMSKL